MRHLILMTMFGLGTFACASSPSGAPEGSSSSAATAEDDASSSDPNADHCGYTYTKSNAGELGLAVCKGNVAKVKQILDGPGGDANAKTPGGATLLDIAFHTSVVYWNPGYNTEMITLLLDKGADTNAVFESGATPLGHAAYFGRSDIMRLLIGHGADVNATFNSRYGTNAAQLAAACDFRLSSDQRAKESLQLLVEKGVDLAKAGVTVGSVPAATCPSTSLYVKSLQSPVGNAP